MWGRGREPRWNSATGQQQQQPTPMGGWSMDPNHYTQIPHNQVDWASVAQQWILMKGTQEVLESPPERVIPRHQNQPQNQPDNQSHQPQQNLQHEDLIGEAPMDLDESVSVSTPLYTRSSSTSSPAHMSNSSAPLMTSPKNQGQISHKPPSWLQASSSFPQNDLSELPRRISSSSTHTDSHDGNTYGYHTHTSWTQKQPPVDLGSFSDRGYHHTPAHMQHQRNHSYQEEEAYEEDSEAARRKALPSWIREGLEKVEREKRKAEEKEQLAAAREEERRLRRKRNHQHDGTDMGLWAQEPAPVPQGIFPSVAVEKDIQAEGLSIKVSSVRQSQPQPRQQSLQEILASLTKEEQMEQVMLSVRRQLTKILLEVTNDEMRVVALEALERGRAKQKGLGDYGSGSDSDDQDSHADEDEGPQDEDVDSDEELMAEIGRKKRNYELKTLVDENEEEPERSSSNRAGSQEARTISRSRSKSGETAATGTNGKMIPSIPPPPPRPVTVKITSSEAEKRQGEEKKVDEKKSERDRAHHRSRSPTNQRSRHRRLSSSSPHKDKKRRERSRSRDKRSRRSKSGSRKRDRRERRSSRSSSSKRVKDRRKSRSSSKTRKDKKSHHHRDRHSSRATSRKRSRSRDRKRRNSKSRRPSRRSASSSSTLSSPRSNSSRHKTQKQRQ